MSIIFPVADLLDLMAFCHCVFNLFTGTVFARPHRSFPHLYAIVRAVAQGVSTNQLAQEPGCSYPALLALRYKLQYWTVGVIGHPRCWRWPHRGAIYLMKLSKEVNANEDTTPYLPAFSP